MQEQAFNHSATQPVRQPLTTPQLNSIRVVKDLTDNLQKSIKNNHVYQIELEITKLLASKMCRRPFTYKMEPWGTVTRIESRIEGTPEKSTAPRKTKRIRKSEEGIVTTSCHTFRIENDRILLPWSGRFGLFKRSLRRSLDAQGKMNYDMTPLDLIQVYPDWLDAGDVPPESMKDNLLPEMVLEKRNTRSNVMVEVFYDYIANRNVTFYMRLDGECPINEEKLVALISTLNSLDCIGPSLRGRWKVKSIKQVDIDVEELERINEGAV